MHEQSRRARATQHREPGAVGRNHRRVERAGRSGCDPAVALLAVVPANLTIAFVHDEPSVRRTGHRRIAAVHGKRQLTNVRKRRAEHADAVFVAHQQFAAAQPDRFGGRVDHGRLGACKLDNQHAVDETAAVRSSRFAQGDRQARAVGGDGGDADRHRTLAQHFVFADGAAIGSRTQAHAPTRVDASIIVLVGDEPCRRGGHACLDVGRQDRKGALRARPHVKHLQTLSRLDDDPTVRCVTARGRACGPTVQGVDAGGETNAGEQACDQPASMQIERVHATTSQSNDHRT